MREMLLLGAGASVGAGVPHTFDMTRRIAEQFRHDSSLERNSEVISFIVGGLLFQKGIQGQDPLTAEVNVEELFNAVLLLADRHSLEAAPFVGSWHSMVQEFDKIAAPSKHTSELFRQIYEGVIREIVNALPLIPPSIGSSDIDRAIDDKIRAALRGSSLYTNDKIGREVGEYVIQIVKGWFTKLKTRSPSEPSRFEKEFRQAVQQVREVSGEGFIFKETAEEMIKALADIVMVSDPAKVAYLEPIKRLAAVNNSLVIATLNYDNCIELFCNTNGIHCSTGIDEWSEGKEILPHEGGILLLKLHGSIDWKLTREQQSATRPMPHSIIRKAEPSEVKKWEFRPAVIFGQRNKLTVEGPFLELLRTFRNELNRCDSLTIVGYSFRDDHVNEYITQWINGDTKRNLRIVDPSLPTDNSFVKSLKQLDNHRVEHLKVKAGEGLSQLYPEAGNTLSKAGVVNG